VDCLRASRDVATPTAATPTSATPPSATPPRRQADRSHADSGDADRRDAAVDRQHAAVSRCLSLVLLVTSSLGDVDVREAARRVGPSVTYSQQRRRRGYSLAASATSHAESPPPTARLQFSLYSRRITRSTYYRYTGLEVSTAKHSVYFPSI